MDTLLTRTRRALFDVATLRFFYDADSGDPNDAGDDGAGADPYGGTRAPRAAA